MRQTKTCTCEYHTLIIRSCPCKARMRESTHRGSTTHHTVDVHALDLPPLIQFHSRFVSRSTYTYVHSSITCTYQLLNVLIHNFLHHADCLGPWPLEIAKPVHHIRDCHTHTQIHKYACSHHVRPNAHIYTDRRTHPPSLSLFFSFCVNETYVALASLRAPSRTTRSSSTTSQRNATQGQARGGREFRSGRSGSWDGGRGGVWGRRRRAVCGGGWVL